MYGFKSFADRIEIEFDEGTTAIIGPNGSGKSNIADAIRWVLGEQSAKTLRGTKMEDVIFSGTEKRKAMSYCEVTLTIENEDHGLPVDYSEVCITRRVYRSGESEYYINKSVCRLKDIVELFQDTGSGREGYSIIGQGRVDNILSSKSEDRRSVFEEAAGIVKYKSRSLEANKKMEHTQQNLLRIEDIIEELSVQIEPLCEQSETARRFLLIRDRLRELEINQFLRQYDRVQERIQNNDQTIKQIDDEVQTLQEKEKALSDEYSEMDQKILHFEQDTAQKRQRVLEMTGLLEKTQGEEQVLRERIEFGKQGTDRIHTEIEMKNESMARTMAQLKECQACMTEKEQQLMNKQIEVLNSEKEYNRVTALVEEKEAELEKSMEARIATINRLSDVKLRSTHLTTLKDSLLKRFDNVQENRVQIENRRSEKNKEFIEAVASMDKSIADVQNIQQNKQAKLNDIFACKQRRETLYDDIQNSEGRVQALSSKLHVLNEMKKDYEGYQTSVKRLLQDVKQQKTLNNRIHGVIAELMYVPQQYEKAIEMTLGQAIQNIVTPTEADAKELIAYLREQDYGRATFLPLTSIQSRKLSRQEENALHMDGVLGVASSLIQFDAQYQNVFENLLGRTVVVKDMDSAIAVARKFSFSFRIVTQEGDLLNVGGSMTGGSTRSKVVSLIGREREIEQAQKDILQTEKKIAEMKQKLDEELKIKEALEVALKALEDESGGVQIRLAKDQERKQIIQENLNEFENQIEQICLEMEQLQESLKDIDVEMDAIAKLQGDIHDEHTTSQEDISGMQTHLSEVKKQREILNEALTRAKVDMATVEKEKHAFESELHRLTQKQNRLKEEIALQNQSAENQEERIAHEQILTQKIEEMATQYRTDLENIKIELKKIETAREMVMCEFRAYEQKKQDVVTTLTDLYERRHKAEMQKQKAESDLEATTNRIWEEYELTYAGAVEYRHENVLENDVPGEINKLKKEMKELGIVNIGAIEEYQRVRERHDYLTKQREDLLTAQEHLSAVIAELQVLMEVRFKEKFVLINQNFIEIFQQLFGGGHAELILQDKQNVLECGIEIVAQPPGKKLQMLSLLSGGERALTAIALLFAMLKLKPTPFCVLDEIEAALDEANVNRYAEFLEDYAQKTQFVVVTHRKGTMEACNSLYGVAMEEKGVSRMVSVRLTGDDQRQAS